ncbi:hypothetical protein OC523_007210 [Vibrio vulnificus]|uniref:hypothetical protein n=1 Tax=Vibrio TaxID=662 RepID=UPI0008932255|nr:MULTISPECIES: hypothetical protein [Vibrio]EHI9302693.1 hypothetical protein [Vibrio vulnificus]EGR3456761.1 hypothetical protein [Vibrio parahaemolyticus]EHK8987364.1 hypothetical protein [Vibrio vulnificus]EHV5553089.1 hypothetical protein [Vibrio vulnificus]EJG0884858.1 hypothetical protein [Vibrio parahaemolyticus]
MSFDIIILKPVQDLDEISDLSDVETVEELGSSDDVYSHLSSFFPGCRSGLWVSDKGHALEIMDYEDNSQSLHLALKFGPNWNDSMSDEFMGTLKAICSPKRWAAFSVQDNERIV